MLLIIPMYVCHFHFFIYIGYINCVVEDFNVSIYIKDKSKWSVFDSLDQREIDS